MCYLTPKLRGVSRNARNVPLERRVRPALEEPTAAAPHELKLLELPRALPELANYFLLKFLDAHKLITAMKHCMAIWTHRTEVCDWIECVFAVLERQGV